MELFCWLTKIDPFQGIAEGVAACEEVDRDGEMLDYFASKPYFRNWSQSVLRDSGGKSFCNVRYQHDDKRPVGKLLFLEFDDANRAVRVEAKISEPEALNQLRDGILTGFSIGGSYFSKIPMTNGRARYVANPSEISVCDRPCSPSATFSVVKFGKLEKRHFAQAR